MLELALPRLRVALRLRLPPLALAPFLLLPLVRLGSLLVAAPALNPLMAMVVRLVLSPPLVLSPQVQAAELLELTALRRRSSQLQTPLLQEVAIVSHCGPRLRLPPLVLAPLLVMEPLMVLGSLLVLVPLLVASPALDPLMALVVRLVLSPPLVLSPQVQMAALLELTTLRRGSSQLPTPLLQEMVMVSL
jgi:hypothetical protein